MDISSLKDLAKYLLSSTYDDSKGRKPFSDTGKRTVSAPAADMEIIIQEETVSFSGWSW
jgi:hypothetical protein